LIVRTHALGVQYRSRSGFPFNAQRIAALARRVGVSRNHCDAGAELHDGDDPADGSRPGIVDALRCAAERGRPRDNGAQHPGDAYIQTELAAAIYLFRRLYPLDRLADHGKFTWRLEVYRVRIGRRKLAGCRRELPVAGVAAAGTMDDAMLGPARFDAHPPALGGSRDQHHPGGRAGEPECAPTRGDAHAAAGELRLKLRVVVDRGHRRRLDAHPLEVALELLGEQLRETGVDALAHLGFVHDQGHGALRVDLDEGIDLIRVRAGGRGRGRSCRAPPTGRGQAEADDESAADAGGAAQEFAARCAVGGVHGFSPSAAAAW